MFRRRPPLPPFPPGALLVGGAARDWLRGAEPKDFDWAAPDPEGAARTLAAALGGSAFPLDEERGYWRVHAGDGVQHDFVPLPEDMADDLLRRDFTVNALALTERHAVLDPSGGRADLRARRLRMVSAANLRADPLRAWRAVRFEIALGFRLEAATETEVRAVAVELAAGRLPMPAPERVREELHALLAHKAAARGILRLEDLGLLALTLPELREGIGVVQGGFTTSTCSGMAWRRCTSFSRASRTPTCPCAGPPCCTMSANRAPGAPTLGRAAPPSTSTTGSARR